MLDEIANLRFCHLGRLIRVKGVVTIRSEVMSQLKKLYYTCVKCGFEKGPYYINSFHMEKQINLGQCAACQSKGPFTKDRFKTIYRNYQKLTIQESPSDVLPGRIPRTK